MGEACGLPQPGRVRRNLGIFCSKEEMDSLSLISNRISCADQALKLAAIPNDATDKSIEVFVRTNINVKAENQFLAKEWWHDVIEKYNLPKDLPVQFDNNTREFFVLEKK